MKNMIKLCVLSLSVMAGVSLYAMYSPSIPQTKKQCEEECLRNHGNNINAYNTCVQVCPKS